MTYPSEVLTESPSFLQGKTYDAIADRQPYADFISPGIVNAGDFEITAIGGLTIQAASGIAYVPGQDTEDQGLYRIATYEPTGAIALPAAHATKPRIDAVILRVLDDSADSSGFYEGRIEVVPGTPTTGATLANNAGLADMTALDDSSTSFIWLATVLVPAAASSIDSSKIKDRRELCSVGSSSIGLSVSQNIEIIQVIDLLSDTATFDFTDVPDTYEYLILYHSLRTDEAGESDGDAYYRFNNDSGAHYYVGNWYGYPSEDSTAHDSAETEGFFSNPPGALGTANHVDVGFTTIFNYATTDWKTSWSTFGTFADALNNTGPEIFGGIWDSTAVVNRITIVTNGVAKFKTNCKIVLMGVKLP